jgi:N-acetylglucosamine-6-phosphate deacetylase
VTRTVITNGSVLRYPGRQFERGDLVIEGERITSAVICGSPVTADDAQIDASDLFIVPGFIDLQINGIGGVDFSTEPERIVEAAALLPRYGVTSFLPTIVSSPASIIERAKAAVAELLAQPLLRHARPLGLHLEGPFLNPSRGGAHQLAHLRTPSLAAIETWLPSNGVALVTLAPELPGSALVVRTLIDRGVTVFAGHTDASASQMRAALSNGVRGLTHLFNAMPSIHHRDPGPVVVVLTDSSAVAGLIVDGVHVDPLMVDFAYRHLGPERTLLVSDATAAAAMPEGSYRLGDLDVEADSSSVRLPSGVLAGSVLTLDVAVRNLMAYAGCTMAEAVQCATSAPAQVLGRSDVGFLKPGAYADIVGLDSQGHVALTLIGGNVSFVR